jgi:hypothetical protein
MWILIPSSLDLDLAVFHPSVYSEFDVNCAHEKEVMILENVLIPILSNDIDILLFLSLF